MTMREALDPKANSLNLLRLVLAALVIVSHARPVGGFGPDPAIGGVTLGTWAVAGFFGISGWLITSSRLSSGLGSLLWRRSLRIYPGFIVCMLIVGFGFAPLAPRIGGGAYSLADGARFVGDNLALRISSYNVGNTLDSVPFPNVWIAPLWTLFFEVLCYIVVAAFVTVAREAILQAAGATYLGCVAMQAAIHWGNFTPPETIELFARLGGFFIAGALLYLLRDHIGSSWRWVADAAAILVAQVATSSGLVTTGLPVAYLTLWAGARLPFTSIGRRNDLSYGLYIYGFPVQQSLVLLGAQSAGLVAFAALGVVATVPFVAASWYAVEKPAMRMRRLVGQRT